MSSVSIDQVQRLAKQLSSADQLRLVEELAHALRQQQDNLPGEFSTSASTDAAARILPQEDFSDWEKK